MKVFNFSMALLLLSLVFVSCQKGKLIEKERLMQFKLEAFYPDTSLFSTVSIDDNIVLNNADQNPGDFRTLVNLQDGIPFTDKARLKVTVVKKNQPNLELDSTIGLNNYNEFLLLQLDPAVKPILINKLLEYATSEKPGKDSIRVRFFYNSNDYVKYPNSLAGPLAKEVKIVVYSADRINTSSAEFGNKQTLSSIRVKLNSLSEYISLPIPSSGPQKIFGFDLLTTSNQVIQKHLLDPYFGFEYPDGLGSLGNADPSSGIFQTCRLRGTYDPLTRKYHYSINYLFGLN